MTAAAKTYRLDKSRKRLRWAYALSAADKSRLEEQLSQLDEAVLAGDKSRASTLAQQVEHFIEPRYKRPLWSYAFEIISAVTIALLIAVVVRQMWFEMHEIPSGSMRPTYKEQDRLAVSKVAFGVNAPFSTDHLYFDPSLVERTSVFTFSADNIPMQDADTTYFGLFPYKKRLIKRLMGKPGDTLYFYGGKVYGIDAADKPLTEYASAPWMESLEYIPFMQFSGEVEQSRNNTFILKLMNLPLGKITRDASGQLNGEIFNGSTWVADDPNAAKKPHTQPKTYSDFWGLGNFAMAQLVNRQQLDAYRDPITTDLPDAPLYLELRHNPSISTPAPRILKHAYGSTVALSPYRSYIPLTQELINTLMDHLYTARFVITNGNVHRYSPTKENAPVAWRMDNMPDGTYEFYNGKGYQIAWGGVAYELPADSPLYARSPALVQNLFNLGMELHPAFQPRGDQQVFFPHRYAYYRNGDLYTMGAPLLHKGDDALVAFETREQQREAKSTSTRPYVAFQDNGPPQTADEKLDIEFIKNFGLKIPEGHYLALGDNHAMSGDSRIWGFVPEANIQGAPSFVIWPSGPRWGWAKNQPETPWFTVPHALVWGTAAAILAAALAWRIHRNRQPIFKKID
jgi:signal peptidase I